MFARPKLPLGEVLLLYKHCNGAVEPGRRVVHDYLKTGMGRRHQIDKIQIRSMSMLDFFRRRKKAEEGASSVPQQEDSDDESSARIFDLEEEVHRMTEEEIEAKRNISRLRPDHWNLVHGKLPHPVPIYSYQHTLKYKRKMFAMYGESSGVDPGYLWPTKEELKNRLEYERIAYPLNVQELFEKRKAIKKAQHDEFVRREKEIDEKMKLVEKYKAELFARQQAKEDELNASKQRREQLMEEVRRHFGYTVDPKDERFQELLAKKEKEQKKAMKEARKLEKQNRNLERLQSKEGKSSQESKKESEIDD